jgi:hypothetical protein
MKSTDVNDENICQRPHQGKLVFIPFPESIAQFLVTVKDASIDNFKAQAEVFR